MPGSCPTGPSERELAGLPIARRRRKARARAEAGRAIAEKLCRRCLVTTVDPDILTIDPDVLRRIRADYGARFALNCHVAEPGRVAVGDPVQLLS